MHVVRSELTARGMESNARFKMLKSRGPQGWAAGLLPSAESRKPLLQGAFLPAFTLQLLRAPSLGTVLWFSLWSWTSIGGSSEPWDLVRNATPGLTPSS